MGDKILLMGDFNKDMYTGPCAMSLTLDELRLSEMCYKATGFMLPPTHMHGHIPTNAVFGTSGLSSTAAALLTVQVRVGNHQVFILDIASETILGNLFPRVIQVASRHLNCTSDKIRNNYILVLTNQLSNRHLIFNTLLRIDRDSDHISPAQVLIRMNKVDLKLKQFMKSAESNSHKYKHNNIKWSPYAGV